MFYKIDVFENFAKLAGKHLYRSLFFNKVSCLQPAIFFKRLLRHKFLPVNFAKFLRTPFLQNTSRNCICTKILSVYFFNLNIRSFYLSQPCFFMNSRKRNCKYPFKRTDPGIWFLFWWGIFYSGSIQLKF